MKTLLQPMIEPVQELGPCLKQILQKKRISASELARMMAYKSRNSIFRILDEKGGHSAQRAFYERLIDEDPLALSDDERAALAQALEVSRVGVQAFSSNRAMRELLMNVTQESPKVRIETGDADDPDFHKALERLARGRKAYMTITGCCDRAIFEALRERVYKTNIACEVKITHFIYTGEEEIVRSISAIQPLLYCECYSAYGVEPGRMSKERESLYRSNCIYIHAQEADGEWYDQQMILVDKGVFSPLHRFSSEEEDPYMAFFARDMARMPQMKASFSQEKGMQSYLAYTEDCRRLEQNRAIYTIKLDIPINLIHTDVLLPCARDSFEAIGLQDDDVLNGLVEIHRQRYENFMTKKKPTHTILSRTAMERFARTGRQSDHFFALRTYTPKERAAILCDLRKQAEHNPNFFIYFFKEEFEPPLTEVGLYEGVGTLLTKPYTHYDLAGDHAEAVITQEEFGARYKEFFVGDLLERHVLSSEETLRALDELIEIAESAE